MALAKWTLFPLQFPLSRYEKRPWTIKGNRKLSPLTAPVETADFCSSIMKGSYWETKPFAMDLEEMGADEPPKAKDSMYSIDVNPHRHLHSSGPKDLGLKNSVIDSIRIVLLSTKLNLMAPFGFLAIIANMFSDAEGCVFILTLLGMIPLAERLSYATEQLACFTGPTVGGLLNATFGNATELIISVNALRKGMVRVVQQSLLGSILSNMLLVLGCAFFAGGLTYSRRDQVFNKATAIVDSGLLLVAVMGLLLPAVLHVTHTEMHKGESELHLSRFCSCVMLVAYATYIYYQLKREESPTIIADEESPIDDEEQSPEISKYESLTWLFIFTICISILSDYLVRAIEGASTSMKIPVAFISVVLLPTVGNAAEHASAIMFATKDKLDISLGVAIGSSTQIAMFGIPFSVVVGWCMGCPMDLNFQLFETATLFMSVIVVTFLLQEGTSNYFKGLMLLFCYLIVSASFFVHIDPDSVVDKPLGSDESNSFK